MGRHLFIVSKHHPRLYDYLIERFHDDGNVQVILDRRASERAAAEAAQRQEERRQKRAADDDLTLRSHMIITLDTDSDSLSPG